MSGKTTPEEVLNSITEGINAGDLHSLMTLYEPLACFALFLLSCVFKFGNYMRSDGYWDHHIKVHF
jgi:hypothetical protein